MHLRDGESLVMLADANLDKNRHHTKKRERKEEIVYIHIMYI